MPATPNKTDLTTEPEKDAKKSKPLAAKAAGPAIGAVAVSKRSSIQEARVNQQKTRWSCLYVKECTCHQFDDFAGSQDHIGAATIHERKGDQAGRTLAVRIAEAANDDQLSKVKFEGRAEAVPQTIASQCNVKKEGKVVIASVPVITEGKCVPRAKAAHPALLPTIEDVQSIQHCPSLPYPAERYVHMLTDGLKMNADVVDLQEAVRLMLLSIRTSPSKMVPGNISPAEALLDDNRNRRRISRSRRRRVFARKRVPTTTRRRVNPTTTSQEGDLPLSHDSALIVRFC